MPVRAARSHVQALEAESEGLSPIRFIRRKQLDRELPEARRQAQELATAFMDRKKVAERPVVEEVNAELDQIGKAIEPGEDRARDARIELMGLQGQQKAQQAAKAAAVARGAADAEKARQIARAREQAQAVVAQRAAAKAAPKTKERDQGPTLGM